jgi:hypothetical protein
MSEWQIALIFIGTFIGGACVGYLWTTPKISFWRIKWIEMEHKLAHLENRKPRNIEEVKE